MNLFKAIIWILVVGGICAGGYYYYLKLTAVPERTYKTAPVKKGSLVQTITATGTVEPEEVVDIGAQVAGQINTFGVDKDGKQVDYGSIVDAGTMLAQIDSSLYDADLAQAKAQVDVDRASVAKAKADADTAKAKLEQAQSDLEQFKAKVDQALTDLDMFKAKQDQANADVQQAQAKLDQAQRDWDRAQKLGPSDALSQESYDTYKGVYEAASAALTSFKAIAKQSVFSISSQNAVIAQAKANLASQNAVIAQAKANTLSADAVINQAIGNVAHDDAAVMRAQQNVNYCVIKSPVKGVIVDRRVNIGQTVVSSLNAPSLFLLAKDLTRIQVWVSMNEADIGNIHPGQPVTFTVDAYPYTTFKGSVRKVRLNATMTQNVVTYTIEVETDNSDGKLLPYLTANTQFEVARRDDVLMVPNAALRFTPQKDEIEPDVTDDAESPHRASTGTGSGAATDETPPTKPSGTEHRGPRADKSDASAKPARDHSESGPRTHGKVWVEDGKFLKPIRVRLGITDGVNTEIKSDELKEDMQLVVGRQMQGAADASGTTNPFQPTNPFGRRQSKPSESTQSQGTQQK
ncbi:MAG TPA: efflux RND transporter periplasmic adaptor subunit [Planctomycetota bacterium]|nr:efflux RND transporter periplasmic adaptor subunit [Planctomycetota bacterium]